MDFIAKREQWDGEPLDLCKIPKSDFTVSVNDAGKVVAIEKDGEFLQGEVTIPAGSMLQIVEV